MKNLLRLEAILPPMMRESALILHLHSLSLSKELTNFSKRTQKTTLIINFILNQFRINFESVQSAQCQSSNHLMNDVNSEN